MEARISATVTVRPISWSWLRRSISFCSSTSEVVSRIFLISSKEQRSLMPHSFTSKEKKPCASTQPLVMTLTFLASSFRESSIFSTTRFTPALSAFSAISRVILAPASISSSPVSGATTFSAATWPVMRRARDSFLFIL